MTLAATKTHDIETGQGSIAWLSRALSSPWLGLALAAAAVTVRALAPVNGDVSWLLTIDEKILDGARPYVDVIECNVPASFLFYAPAVVFARWTHLGVQFSTAAYVCLCAVACVLLSGRVLRAAGLLARREAGFLVNAAVFALLLVPGYSFAQREHNASILILPILSVYAARAAGARVGYVEALAAGLAAATAMSIKPHFALAVLAPFAYALARRRSLALVFAPEQLVAVAAALANLVALLVWFHAYFPLAAMLLDVYTPMREPFGDLLTESWFAMNVALLAGLAAGFGRACLAPRVAVLALGSLGFVGAYLVQGKGWGNHGLPGVELAFLAIAMAIAPVFCAETEALRQAGWGRLRRYVLFVFLPAMLGAPVLFGALLSFTGFESYPGLTAAVRRVAPPHPKIIAVSQMLDVGSPLTRNVGGEWAGRPNALWEMIFSQTYLDLGRGDAAYRARLADYVERDARMFREDVEANRPDIVLVPVDPRVEKAMRNPDIVAALNAYAPVETAGGVAIWTRRP